MTNVIEIHHPPSRPQGRLLPQRAEFPTNSALLNPKIRELLAYRKRLRDTRADLFEALVEWDAAEKEVQSELAKFGL